MDLLHNITAYFLRRYVNKISKKKIPRFNGKIEAPELNGESSVLMDKWGVPHIYANDNHDLFFVQGFMHASDRLFQMEIARRLAHGKLSEWFGEETFDTDRFSRSLCFTKNAEQDSTELSPLLSGVLEAYVKGVNFFIEKYPENYPAEYSLLKQKPEKWQLKDSLAIARLMSWQMGFVWHGKLVREKLEKKLGLKTAEIDLNYYKENPETLDEGREFNVFEFSRELKKATGPWLQDIKGSNTWTISGKLTDTGFPYLCNDMHLASLQPSIWYQNHLESKDLKVSGVSVPGIPMILIGHNKHIAWGATLAFTEIQDLVLIPKESIKKGSHTDSNGKTLSITEREEVFHIKGRKSPANESFYNTDFGPVLHTLSDGEQQLITLYSPAFFQNNILDAWNRLNKAENWNHFVNAVKDIDAPALCLSYADVYGNTGYFVSGKTPKRKAPEGSYPYIENLPDKNRPYLSTEEKPYAFNTEKGYLVNSNNKIVNDDYPFYLGHSWMDGFRAKRIKYLLEKKSRFSISDMQQIQADLLCIPGLKIRDIIITNLSKELPAHKAVEMISSWDGNTDTESAATCIYEVWKICFLKKVFKELLGEDSFAELMGEGTNEVLHPMSELYGQEATIILNILENESTAFLKKGDKEKIISDCMTESIDYLEKKLGKDSKLWKWGQLHKLVFMHPFGKKSPMDKVFNQGPFPYGGNTDTACQAAWHPSKPFSGSLIIPSARFIYDLSNWENSLISVPPGQSERIGSPHYNDQLDDFLHVRYKPLLWEKDTILKNSQKRIDFTAKK
ncbi:MAG: penicillin acylase family protein [Chitinophagaceae bacterium]|nr:MAG: penicillin acylase family protein [Chitinophagaceae bacterium]